MTERENALHVLKGDGMAEWVPCITKAVDLMLPPVIEDKKQEGMDWFGIEWTENFPLSHLTDSIDDWREVLHFPDLEAINWEKAAQDMEPALDRENKVQWAMMSQGLFERAQNIISFDEALTCYYENPEETKALIGALADFRYRLTEKVLQYFNPDIINYRDDYGNQKSTFFSPDIFREFYKPHLERLAKQAHEAGKIFILHSCGKVDGLIGDFIDLGVDVWDSVQPCCDLTWIYQQYGDQIGFSSSLNLQLFQNCTEEEARQCVRDTIDLLGGNKRLMIWDAFPLALPLDSAIITDETEKYGRK